MRTKPSSAAVNALNLRFLLDYPREAALQIEGLPPDSATQLLGAQPVHAIVPVWEHLTDDVVGTLIRLLPDKIIRGILSELEPARAAALLNRLEPDTKESMLSLLDAQIARELRELASFPADTAGHLMDPRVYPFRRDSSARDALKRLRVSRPRHLREIYLTDADGRLDGRVEIQDLAMAEPEATLNGLAHRIVAAVQSLAPREEVVEKLEQYKLFDLPVVDIDGRLVGVIHHSGLVTALQEEASLDIQTMVGVSKDERALSGVTFSVAKRLPWLHINLLTAFLAAAVVGLFENTIAQFTALAVLLPVVAGQSGNAGAQALAVTMRGLALREIGIRHWPRVVFKEVNVGFLNGVAIAVTTAIGVYVWSRSLGLAFVIACSMVLSMVAAGFSGAIIPIALTRVGQDPAQSSSIVLTTVTDVVGFFSFLGIATLLSTLL
jgi:magnesium transporter